MSAPRADAGFTLVELIISIAIIGIIVPVLGNVIVVYYRTAAAASVRTDRAHDANLFSANLQPDLASATSSAVSGSCANTLTLQWSESHETPNGSEPSTVYTVTYTTSPPTGDDGARVIRTASKDGTPTSTQVVMHNLADQCAMAFAQSTSGALTTVTAAATYNDPSARAEAAQLKLSGVLGGRA